MDIFALLLSFRPELFLRLAFRGTMNSLSVSFQPYMTVVNSVLEGKYATSRNHTEVKSRKPKTSFAYVPKVRGILLERIIWRQKNRSSFKIWPNFPETPS